MRIAYRADPRSSNGKYRGLMPMTALAGFRGHEVRRLFTDDARPIEAQLDGVDVVFIHRYCAPHALELARRAQKAGAAIMWDNDDDMGAMPRTSVTYRHFGGIAWERRLVQMRQLFAYIDLATSPSRALSDRFGQWGAPATGVIENYVVDTSLEIDQRPHSGTTIGWIAGGEHAMDIQHLPIVEVLRRILEERPDVRVVSVGLNLALKHERYEHISSVSLWDISQTAAEFDIAIAPIADTDFNRSRSSIKVKEYAAGGTPWLASPIGPYAGLGEKQGGRLVPDDGWYEAIVRLIDKPRERRKLAKRAVRWGAAQALSKNLEVWEAQLDRVVELRRERAGLRAPRSSAA
jgi:glycosyltransferase involved in cell wall biosynthesis